MVIPQNYQRSRHVPSSFIVSIQRFLILYTAWKGVLDSGIYFASMDVNNNWSPPTTIPGASTDASPSLAVFNDRLYVAFKGLWIDSVIYFVSMDRNNRWTASTRFLPGRTLRGPALVSFNACLYNVYSGNPTVRYLTNICYSYYPYAGNRGF